MKTKSFILLLIALSFSYQIQAQRPYVQQEAPAQSYNSYQRPANAKALIGVGATFLAVGGGFVYGAYALNKIDQNNNGTTDHGIGIICCGVGAGFFLLTGAILTPIGIALQVRKRKGLASLKLNGTSNSIGLAYNF